MLKRSYRLKNCCLSQRQVSSGTEFGVPGVLGWDFGSDGIDIPFSLPPTRSSHELWTDPRSLEIEQVYVPASDVLHSLMTRRTIPSFDKLIACFPACLRTLESGEVFLQRALVCRIPLLSVHCRTAVPPTGTEQPLSLSFSSGAHTSLMTPSPGVASVIFLTVKLGLRNRNPQGRREAPEPCSAASHCCRK